MEDIKRDFRYAVRMMAKAPFLTAAAILALGLGIGANTAVFSVINSVMLRSLPYKAPERLVVVWETQNGNERGPVSAPNFFDWREQGDVFDHIGAIAFQPFNITGSAEAERVQGSFVSASLFDVFGIAPALGHTFTPEEDKPGHGNVVVVSHNLWKQRLGSDPGVIGMPLTLNGKDLTIVGVMPAGFQMVKEGKPGTFVIDDSDVWVPVSFIADLAPGLLERRNTHFLRVIASLKPGVSLQQAKSAMSLVANRLEKQYPDTNTGLGVDLVPLHEQLIGQTRPVLLILFGAVSLVLLIACANVANLLLTRALARQKEMAIRLAMGASRGRLIRQFLTESLVLSSIGGALGLLLAYWGISVLVSLSPGNIPRVQESRLDLSVLGFTLGVSILTGIVFGFAPALQATRPDVNKVLKEENRGSSSAKSSQRMRNLLIISEVAVALVLLVGAGLLIKSFLRLQSVAPGYDPHNVLTMELLMPTAKYSEGAQLGEFYRQLLERAESLPGSRSAAIVSNLPLRGTTLKSFSIEGRPDPPTGQSLQTSFEIVSPRYFETLGIPLRQGRAFSEQDRADATPVVIINEAMARRYWEGENPMDKRLLLSDEQVAGAAPVIRQIIGVVGDVRHSGLEAPPGPEVYVPYLQSPSLLMTLVVRSSSDQPKAMTGPVRRVITALDKDLPVANVTTMEQMLDTAVAQKRFNMLLLSIFAGVALLLSAVGIYAVISYSVGQRKQEIGIRLALGASPGQIFKLVVGQGMWLVLIGLTIGLAAAFALKGILDSLLYGISATDPITYIGTPVLLILVALLASYIPARRAVHIDPITAMRAE